MSFDSVVHNFPAGIFARLCPDGEAKLSASSQDAERFRARFLRLREVEQPKIHHSTVETCVRERQPLRIAFDEIDSGKRPARDREHFFEKSTPVGIAPSC